ncbi:hypothetical protein OROGR_021617 [Orobanche gracilis]
MKMIKRQAGEVRSRMGQNTRKRTFPNSKGLRGWVGWGVVTAEDESEFLKETVCVRRIDRVEQVKHGTKCEAEIGDKDSERALEIASQICHHKLEDSDFCDGIPCGVSLESDLQEKLFEERIMSHYHTSQNLIKNCLCTNKYQPQNAKQISGNCGSVKFLSEWLHLWHKRGSLTSRGCINVDYSAVQDIDHDYQQSDSDTDSGDESLKNVLLLAGPVGSGKSAAIYACARDQGFQIIEILPRVINWGHPSRLSELVANDIVKFRCPTLYTRRPE